jgi:hypothetical protein
MQRFVDCEQFVKLHIGREFISRDEAAVVELKLGTIARTEYMADQDQKLCDRCHERPATSHICYGHGGESRSLCQICLRQDLEIGGLIQRFDESVRVGHCKYCGAPAETGWGGSSSILGENFNLVCMACFDDLAAFARRPENAISDFTPGDEVALRRAAEHLADMEKRQDEFIRRRVLERKSK